MRDNRMVLLRLPEVSFAESEGNDVWLSTDQGRLRAASQGLDKLDGELADAGFLRVHRRYVVNLSRVREIERGRGGELSLVMDDGTNRDGAGLPAQRAGRAPGAGHLTTLPGRIPVSDSPDAVVGEVNDASGAASASPPRPRAPATRRGARRNRDWWPNQLDLTILAETPRRGRPHGRGLRLRRGVPDPRPRRPGEGRRRGADDLAGVVACRLRPLRAARDPDGVALRRDVPRRRRPRRRRPPACSASRR